MKKVMSFMLVFTILSISSFANVFDDQKAFTEVSKKVMPAVVNISTEKVIKQRYYDPFEDLFNDQFFGRNNQRREPREIKRKQTALGSGFIISEDGYIVTNNHVVDGADKIKVTLNDKSTYSAKLIGTDKDTDIAILKIKSNKKFKYLTLGNSSKLEVGQWAIAIGNPFGLNNTMTVGIISAKGRSGMGIENYENFIQTDASINPGNSGGPLVDINGNVIGINTAILSKSGGNMGIGFAIPIDMVKPIKNSLIKNGKVERGWLGVSIQPLNDKMAEKFGLKDTKGALIGEVLKGTPAEKAGLKRGDIVLQINGEKVKDYNDLRNKIGAAAPGTKVDLRILRNRKKINIRVKLGKKANNGNGLASEEQELMGMKIKNIDNNVIKQFNLDKNTKGVIVLEVSYDSQAYSYGVRPGDIIVEVNNNTITNVNQIMGKYKKTKKGDGILFYIEGKNASRYIMLEKD
ncbi:DegQ family serine endoprotease [Haliovirga abyssi]|uniref:Probable periplasmic serine endoprotease DegP-like n=1 Tax=Haliovirga abyssi TaxID=2996794 RepID=A0AAU9DHE6_9FUSO|nr:DegQ family serine endoprotease [Haliovirga abyssi]BDU51713.1 putative periplasmic serine endoprotease DegP-like protein [Haliovirga abyssi]